MDWVIQEPHTSVVFAFVAVIGRLRPARIGEQGLTKCDPLGFIFNTVIQQFVVVDDDDLKHRVLVV